MWNKRNYKKKKKASRNRLKRGEKIGGGRESPKVNGEENE